MNAAYARRWSVESLEDFWEAVRRFYQVRANAPARAVVPRPNDAGSVLVRGRAAEPSGACAQVRGRGPDGHDARARGSAGRGDTRAAAAPDFGTRSVIDRSALLEPKVLIAAAGYRLGGREHDRRHVLDQLRAALPTLQHTILVGGGSAPNANAFENLTTPPRAPGFAPVPFAHPLWVLFSAGTTGIPKGIIRRAAASSSSPSIRLACAWISRPAIPISSSPPRAGWRGTISSAGCCTARRSSCTRAARRTRAATPCGRRQEIPRTLTGKKLEVPVERILAGAAVEAVAAPGAVDKPGALRWSEQLGSQPTGVAR